MFKKTISWTLYIAFIGLLVFGAINRTSSRISDSSDARNANRSVVEGSAITEIVVAPHEDKGHDASEAHLNEASGYEWIIMDGVVTNITNREMIVTLADGEQISLARRAWRFSQEQGFTPQVGNTVTVTGYHNNGEFEIAQIRDLDNGQVAIIRDENGHPLWASGELDE